MAELVLYDITHSKTIAVPEDDQHFGRHLFFECDDKHVSRHHGLIKSVKEGEIRTVFIKALHETNHLYYRRNKCAELLELAKDEGVSLKEGDQFGLLEKFFWYEVRAKEDGMNEENTQPAEPLQAQSGDEVNNNDTRMRTSTTKRKPDELPNSSEEARSSKRNRANSEDQLPCSSTSSDTTEPVAANDSGPQSIKTETASPTSTVSVKPDPDAAGSVKPDPEAAGSVKPDPDAAVDSKDGIFQLLPTLPDTSTLRPSCEFGIRCYRGGRDHRDQFAHPGDRDYRRPYFPPAPADAPFCPYGARCYRRNPQHFVDFQHYDSNIYF
ncbi:aprataxin and PNK-like factor isoform X2 [Anopheles cruzii]|uniref:aprataxin and PNK-like factor isoform X2 n=1 Tax=Anopheles cruzii TaxID=68878 RepID=UPI0022EC424A|nr:aprataxin and PNK-like factor isoform X2 [Anopheles cruzii]